MKFTTRTIASICLLFPLSVSLTLLLLTVNSAHSEDKPPFPPFKTIRTLDVDTPRSVSFSPDGKSLACLLNNNEVHILDLATWKMGEVICKREVSRIGYTPKGKHLILAGPEITIWDLEKNKSVLEINTHCYHSPISPDEKRLYFYTKTQIIVFDLEKNEIVDRLPSPPRDQWWGGNMALSKDGKYLAVSGIKSIEVWDTTKLEKLYTFSERGNHLLAFHPDNQTLISAGVYVGTGNPRLAANEMVFWDLTKGEAQKTVRLNDFLRIRIEEFILSRDGKFVFASVGNTHVIDLKEGKEIATAMGTLGVKSILSSDDKILARIGPKQIYFYAVEDLLKAPYISSDELLRPKRKESGPGKR
jgi:WD40 repeat protein